MRAAAEFPRVAAETLKDRVFGFGGHVHRPKSADSAEIRQTRTDQRQASRSSLARNLTLASGRGATEPSDWLGFIDKSGGGNRKQVRPSAHLTIEPGNLYRM